jgi:hypothetical protein
MSGSSCPTHAPKLTLPLTTAVTAEDLSDCQYNTNLRPPSQLRKLFSNFHGAEL